MLPLAILGAFAATVVSVPIVARAARALGLLAHPTHDRWHREAIPKVGGVAMVLPLLVALVLIGIGGELGATAVAVTLMFALGFADDLRPISPATKLVGQMLVAATFLLLSPPLRILGHPVADVALAFVWIVGITNALNLLDNIDGLAAGVSGIAGAFFLLVLYVEAGGASGPIPLAVAAFVGVAAGFLVYNFHPASIFMGDGGSHLLGSFLACTTLVATSARGAELASVAAIPVVLLLIPIFDTAFVIVSRGLAGRSAFLGGRDHTSHRLVTLGIGDRKAVLALYALTGASGAVALGLLALPTGVAWGLVAVFVASLGVAGVYLGHIEVERLPSVAPALKGRATLIYGAGHGGALAARELLLNTDIGLRPLGFLDDDPLKKRLTIDGLAVLGGLDDLERLLDEQEPRVAAVVVAITDLPPGKFDYVCTACVQRGVAVRRMRFALDEVKRRPDSDQRVVGFPRA